MSGDYGSDDVGGVHLGSMLFTLVEPHPGYEVAYNRWYERDHFYAGCMIGPGVMAGRRWVATEALKALRYPADSPVVEHIDLGSYLATYWIERDLDEAFVAWSVPQVHDLHAQRRMFADRDHTHTLMYRHRWTESRDPDGVPAELALDHPYQGLVAVMVDRHADIEDAELDRWYRHDHLPMLLRDTPIAMCIAFDAFPLPDDAPADVPRTEGIERRSLHLYFLEADPSEVWDKRFRRQGEVLASTGIGQVVWAGPFIPTIPGTDTYADQL